MGNTTISLLDSGVVFTGYVHNLREDDDRFWITFNLVHEHQLETPTIITHAAVRIISFLRRRTQWQLNRSGHSVNWFGELVLVKLVQTVKAAFNDAPAEVPTVEINDRCMTETPPLVTSYYQQQV